MCPMLEHVCTFVRTPIPSCIVLFNAILYHSGIQICIRTLVQHWDISRKPVIHLSNPVSFYSHLDVYKCAFRYSSNIGTLRASVRTPVYSHAVPSCNPATCTIMQHLDLSMCLSRYSSYLSHAILLCAIIQTCVRHLFQVRTC